ncbi:hypothetical protein [Photobacterium sp.]|uniref:hypothetical protein n=1 Tax=Photobacterium sp. TaxID=660 RepID=UPI00299D170A|nr:hypothetical protein [Photobacterium sp.]MDX1303429.1 hypothetical protein [Photobacterium sp.]
MNNNCRPVEDSTQPKKSSMKKFIQNSELCMRIYTYADKLGLLDKLKDVDFSELFQSIVDFL